MVGRNDPCPCGSGKKYKKCCGKEQVVDLQEIISSELEKIMEGFAEDGLEPADFFEVEQRIHKWQNALSGVFDKALIETSAFESYLFFDRVEIWKNYIARQKKHQKRQRIVDVLTSWEEPFYLLAEIQESQDGTFVLRDAVTNEKFLFPGKEQAEPGEWLFGLVMRHPLNDEKELQPTSGIIFIPPHQLAVAEGLKSKLENGFSDSLELYKVFAEQSELPTLPAFERDVLELVEQFLKEHDLKNELLPNMAFAFLMEVPLTARKPEGVAAGILQAMNAFGFFENLYVTQKTLAAYFGTSVASLTKYRNLMEHYLMERVRKMEEKMEDEDFDPELDFDSDMDMPQILTSMGTDPRITERGMWEMVMRMQHSDTESEEDLNQIIQNTMNSPYTPMDDAETAQLTSYQAYDARSEEERRKLAKQAFKLNPENTDANLLMAEITLDPAEKQNHYLQAIESGRQILDFGPGSESAWGYVVNRPLLRALFSYGAWLMAQKKYAEAFEPLENLLKLNPPDQQGARWLLASAYIRAGEWDKAEDFTAEFPPAEYDAVNYYVDSVLDMYDEILSSAELKELKSIAKEWNRHVPVLIKKGKDPGEFPRSLSLESGNEDEAKFIYWLIYGMPGTEKFV